MNAMPRSRPQGSTRAHECTASEWVCDSGRDLTLDRWPLISHHNIVNHGPSTIFRTVCGAILGSASVVALTLTALLSPASTEPRFLLVLSALAVVMWVGLSVRMTGAIGWFASLPLLALFAGELWALATWSLAAAGATWAIVTWSQVRAEAPVRALRRRLHRLEARRDALDQHLRRYPILLDTCLALSSARDVDQVANTLEHGARALLPQAESVRVYLITDGVSRQLAGSGGSDPAPSDLHYAAQENRPLIRRSRSSCTAVLPLRSERRSLGIALPTARSGQSVIAGALVVQMATDHLEDLDLDALVAAARLGGLGLAGVALIDAARALAMTDDLTGLFGHHEFGRRLEEHVAAARRRHGHIAVLACDMDRLKAYNDAYGHPAGDRALLSVASACLAVAPTGAVVSRSGGEEFSLLLPDHDLPMALAVARRLRERVATSTPEPDHPDRHVTISIGLAAYQHGEAASALLARADAACYHAKAAGRNRVEFST